MHRLVKKDITLSDGNVLSAGTRIMVSDDRAHDASIWPGPLTFDAARFLRLREQPGEENRHQFVTTTATLLGFGHGQHACPGRFFASNEMKVLLCFLLLQSFPIVIAFASERLLYVSPNPLPNVEAATFSSRGD